MKLWALRIMALAVCLLSYSPVMALEIVPDRLYLNGYFDATPGYNRYNSDTSGMDAYHWVTIFVWKISDSVRVVGDLTLEHGPIHSGEKSVGDIKTRSFVQLTHSDALKLNIGKFLTPFGMYNLIHDATPTYLSATSPRSLYWKRKIGKSNTDGEFIKDRLFSKEAAGLWIYGTSGSYAWPFEYNLYLVNGRSNPGSNEYQVDDNDDKGVGGKFVATTPYKADVGISFYTEKNGALEGDKRITTYAFMLNYSPSPLYIEAEYLRSVIGAHAGLPKAEPEAFYTQVAYRFLKVYTPYLRYDSYNNKDYGEKEKITTVGVNYMYHPQVYLKGEYGFYDKEEDVIQLQITVGY